QHGEAGVQGAAHAAFRCAGVAADPMVHGRILGAGGEEDILVAAPHLYFGPGIYFFLSGLPVPERRIRPAVPGFAGGAGDADRHGGHPGVLWSAPPGTALFPRGDRAERVYRYGAAAGTP